MTTYNVHLYPTVRVKVSNIEAESHLEAIAKAEDIMQAEYPGMVRFSCGDEAVGVTCIEDAEEGAPYALVDEVGDHEYQNTRWYEMGKVTWFDEWRQG